MKVVKLRMIDGNRGFAYLDLDQGGSSVLVDNAEGFNFEFASYAGSYSPMRIQGFADGALSGVTKEPRYRSFLLDDLRRMEQGAARRRSRTDTSRAGSRRRR